MVIFHIVWTLGLLTMWIRACMVMKKRGRGREDVAGENKAVFELAAAMREQMNEPTKEEGDDVSWIKSHKLSIIAMIICVVAMMINVIVWIPDHTGTIAGTIALIPLPTVLIAALYIGSTRGSRIVLFVWIFVLVVIPTQITVSIATY